LQDPATVQLDWSSVNEVGGRQYAVQRSQDGQHFTTIAILPALNSGTGGSETADYNYDDHLPAGVTGKCYYRLQLSDPGSSTYSIIKEVEVGKAGGEGLSLYPNPAVDFVDLVFARGARAGWQVELLTVDGKRIQNGNYMQPNNIHIDFLNRWPAGVYFIRATERGGVRSYVKRLIKR
jgi:hypothetical protein